MTFKKILYRQLNELLITEDIGLPILREHIASVITLMKTSVSWSAFKRLLERAMLQYGDTYQIPYDEEKF